MSGQARIAAALRRFSDDTAGRVPDRAFYMLLGQVMEGLEEIGGFDKEAFLGTMLRSPAGWSEERDVPEDLTYFVRESTGPDDRPGTHDVIAPHESGEGWGFPDWRDGPSFPTPEAAAEFRAREIEEDGE